MAKKEYIIAPAGHGKTHYIANFVKSLDLKKALVLTHTNAGLNSLIRKFKKEGIKTENYDIFTIDSFSVRYAMAYPGLSGLLKQPETNAEYKLCREGVLEVFEMDFLMDFLISNYSIIIVDEYQDCSDVQHKLLIKISEKIDCLILGDPMQGIFDFDGKATLVSWEEIRENFTESPEKLVEPWRWRKRMENGKNHEELGQWIKDTRIKLEEGLEIEFNGVDIDFYNVEAEAKKEFEEIKAKQPLKPPNFINVLETVKKKRIRSAIKEYDEVLILVNDPTPLGVGREKMSRGLYGMQVLDAMNFEPLYDFLRKVQGNDVKDAFYCIKMLLKMCATRIDELFLAQIETRIKKLWEGVNTKKIIQLRSIKIKKEDSKSLIIINRLYQLFLDVLEFDNLKKVAALLKLMCAVEDALSQLTFKSKANNYSYGILYRRDVFYSAKSALSRYIDQSGKNSLEECGKQIRQRISYVGRNFRKVIGTTLLTKGLEFDCVIIDDPEKFNVKHLYVALSRAKKKILILGNSQRIKKERPENL